MTDIEDKSVKKENSTNYPEWLIAALALLVIFQSVVLISQPKKQSLGVKNDSGLLPVPTMEEVKTSFAQLNFIPSGVSLKKRTEYHY